ncbi:translocation/assembly module TamB domain-containing protein [Geoalkalibacter halelectricus]|uniref:Translocation/assembly module TamB domain-containing protein n=1 Tax=Geoalkalibacter halelectricus TaxID=2847045 RepID=A0ABY5ZIX0_9BACT|nr:translocation/assembly module TamB domain-containing protein [Geoalkalibacter halelectricus]MDO3377934.1 translocation/assembly module TamB domain-containing protein [Geoalkalibacter halelectricus]UWZ77885.1 translocation/assembly module TamB domain-containing protein [Geoalkalibacter halelectricus]
MVMRVLKYVVPGVVLLGLVLLFGAGYWLLRTPEGARWTLAAVSRWTPVTLEAEAIRGRLWGDLELDGLQVFWPGGEARSDALRLRWRPGDLRALRLAVMELDLGRLEIVWDAAEEPPPPAVEPEEQPLRLAWPRLEGLPLRVVLLVERLQAEQVSFGARGTAPQVLADVRLALGWQDGEVSLQDLALAGDFGRIEAQARARLTEPFLSAELRWQDEPAALDIDGVELSLELREVSGLVVGGPVTVQLYAAGAPLVQLEGRLALHEMALSFEELLLARSGAADRVRGTASVDWSGRDLQFAANLNLENLNLEPELGWATDLSGRLEVQGDLAAYAGSIDLRNARPGWEDLALAALVRGSAEDLSLSDIRARWLDGSLSGDLDMHWSAGFFLDARLSGAGLDPGVIEGAPAGRLNFDLVSALQLPPGEDLSVTAAGQLRDSHLLDQPFDAHFDLLWAEEDLHLHALHLQTEGVELEALGRLSEAVHFTALVEDFAVLLPDLSGSARAEGRVVLRDGRPGGEIRAEGSDLAIADLRLARWQLQADLRDLEAPGNIEASLWDMRHGDIRLREVEAQFAGLIEEHAIDLRLDWGTGRLRSTARGGWYDEAWRGEIARLQGEERALGAWWFAQPVRIEAGAQLVELAGLVLEAETGGVLRLDGAFAPEEFSGDLHGSWQAFNLELLNPWLPDMQLAGDTSGELEVRIHSAERLDLAAEIELATQVALETGIIEVREAALTLGWDAQGLAARALVRVDDAGTLTLVVASDDPGAPRIPERGDIEAHWSGVALEDLAARFYLPLDLWGALSADLSGNWDADLNVALRGALRIAEGGLRWRDEDGEITAALQTAQLDWQWQGADLVGELDVLLSDFGAVQGNFQLPLPARLPTAFDEAAPLAARLRVQVREHGLLATFMPGLVDETAGDLRADLQVGGSWATPVFSGDFSLTGAGAILPATGVVLRELELHGELDGQQVRLSSFGVRSGRGRLDGRGLVQLDDWALQSYSFEIAGRDFQVADLPELEIRINPDLRIEGALDRLRVSGEVRVPLFVVTGWQARTPVSPSPDVVFVNGEELEPERGLPLDLDLNLRVILGESVVIKLAGLDARLGGDLTLTMSERNDVLGTGEIRVIQGHYAAYGLRLPITRGRLFFPGGPVERPTLDILALRTVGEVRAGVQVSGTPQVPVVRLYSEPGMPDTDVLSYIVLGRPMGAGQGQVDALMLAAGALLSQGESAALQDRLRRRLGIDVFEVHGGEGEIEAAMVTIGKYLTPDLYISFGQSLFGETNVARMRYSITERWQIESQVGEVSGADLFYRLEFR